MYQAFHSLVWVTKVLLEYHKSSLKCFNIHTAPSKIPASRSVNAGGRMPTLVLVSWDLRSHTSKHFKFYDLLCSKSPPIWHWQVAPCLFRSIKLEVNKNFRQILNKKFFSSSGTLIKKQKLLTILTILMEFFFRGQNLKGLAENQVQNFPSL